MKKFTFSLALMAGGMALAQSTYTGPAVLDPEPLDRGVAVVPAKEGGNYISWRNLVNDYDSITYRLYSVGNDGDTETIYSSKDSQSCGYWDKNGDGDSKYKLYIRKNNKTTERPKVHYFRNGHLDIPISRPAGGTLDDKEYYYVPDDASVADMDGDGEYEVVLKWFPSNEQDNAINGLTSDVYLDCYKLDGTQLWRIDLGPNIRAGAHYTQFLTYDFDGDGKAELALKTAPGTVDGQGKYVIMGDDDPTAIYRHPTAGRVLSGPEYLTIFDGATGAERATTAYLPPRDILLCEGEEAKDLNVGWGDYRGLRSERYLACVAYLDGKHPSMVFCRGYYYHAFLWAVDFDGTNITQRWLHKSMTKNEGAWEEGAHSLAVGDVDEDGRDEIIYGACAIDDDGSLLYRTGFGHGDALHLTDLDPDRPGLEVFMVHEENKNEYQIYDSEMHDARTGEVLWGNPQSGHDIGRGVAADIDSTYRGVECFPYSVYSSYDDSSKDTGLFSCTGKKLGSYRPGYNNGIYWLGNKCQQLLDVGVLNEWDIKSKSLKTITDFVKQYGVGYTLIKYVPCLQADILGDWREEVIYYDGTNYDKLMIFTTPYPTSLVVPCLMQDHIYRMGTLWQNSGYNQPPHISYYLPDFKYDAYVAAMKERATEAGIEFVEADAEASRQPWFDLTGRMIDRPSARGIYLHGSKKVVIR